MTGAMSSAPEFDIDHVANLARIALTPAEKAGFSAQLGDVLAHIALLQEVDVTGIEPTAHAYPMENVWAEDRAVPGLQAEAALQNAPAQRDGMFVVPKVVD
jgi:aspartyl-tRNA(Asn)/glutamyl-tRNA(Gln) amidotransferase subunit C